ncbi:MAG: glycosyl hydrolase [Verrucomicrobiota bacterium]
MMSLPAAAAGDDPLAWPPITRTQKPWTYWWWMGSAVDTNNIARSLARFQQAGLGGVHIIPIYGAKGWESNYISYLSPRWLDMLAFTVSEAGRLDMGVDMTTGTGWCLGGPEVTDEEANASPVIKELEIPAGETITDKFDPKKLEALMAFSEMADGNKIDLLPKVHSDGSVDWTADGGTWRVFAVWQKPSGQGVKRAAPGGEGWMLNPFYAPAVRHYMQWFQEAFQSYTGPRPRALYQDSYEYRSSWAPDLFAQFERRRGYRLQDQLPALFGEAANPTRARVKSDYRETLSDMMIEEAMPVWVRWAHDHGFLVRYQAHGAPGNLLDLYALADVPETEMFHLDRDKLVSKFASSAGHVAGRALVSSETGTWLAEHFTETLAEMKFLQDDLFLSGINHIFYHGCCYSPEEAAWPGWHFYASYEMNPANSIWRDTPALNAYAARCQSLLQSGRPDNDILLYWPIHDFWSDPAGEVKQFTVHARAWLEDQPVGRAANWLWEHGWQFDYVSDRQLAGAEVAGGLVKVPGGGYRAVVVPGCELMPVATLSNLLRLAASGGTVIFDQHLPSDAPGLGKLEQRRAELQALLARAKAVPGLRVGNLETELAAAKIAREPLLDHPGLMCVRRADDEGRVYFVANRGSNGFDGWLDVAAPARAIIILDSMTGATGVAESHASPAGGSSVFVQLAPGQSVFLRALADRKIEAPVWKYWKAAGDPVTLAGTWQIKFLEGGPELPASFATDRLASWTKASDTNAQRFAGAALYTLRFDAPPGGSGDWRLDLGQVCQSARVRLNGKDAGTLFTPPFRAVLSGLKARDNKLEVEVRNVCANRIRDLDQRGVKWKTFHDINFVNLDYRPFDASGWPLADSGLLGPVTLTPVAPVFHLTDSEHGAR